MPSGKRTKNLGRGLHTPERVRAAAAAAVGGVELMATGLGKPIVLVFRSWQRRKGLAPCRVRSRHDLERYERVELEFDP